ncbi:MAG: sulfotransferase domain-containing protein [Sandaracinaceae bacterium]|nr:sulfotransferase domain-containing protein [Sandaracinaceae bacterium]
MTQLDFVGIGATKSGTSTLHRLLADHPQLVLPAGKEAPFFSHDERFHRGWERYVEDELASAPLDRKWGKITPQYLAHVDVPARLHAHNPALRLIALLRNPIDQTYSYYRMVRRDGLEQRSFTDAVTQMQRTAAADRDRPIAPDARAAGYLVRAEYARCISRYLERFDASQLLVHFTEELRDDPEGTLRSVLLHIGVDAEGYRPATLGGVFNRGGEAQRFPWLVPLARRITPLRWAWHRLPIETRRRAAMLWKMEVNVARGAPEPLDPATRAELRAFFAPDVAQLEALLGRPVPWPEFRAAPAARAEAAG